MSKIPDVFAEDDGDYEDDGENPDNVMTKGSENMEDKTKSWKRASQSHHMTPIQTFALPSTPAELKEDPRTSLPILPIPDDMIGPLKFMLKQGQPIIHFIARVDKMNSDGKKWASRFFFITNHAIYALHDDSTVARVIAIQELASITLCENAVLFSSPDDFDLLIRCPGNVDAVKHVTATIYEFKKVTPLLVHVVMSESELLQSAKLQKPKGWKVNPSIPIHTKADLHRQLQILNEHGSFDLDNMDKDPRTGLKIVSVPSEYATTFRGTPFDPNGAEKPLLHFFAQCTKVNHKLKGDARLVMITNSNVYLAYPNGHLQRSIFITLIAQAIKGPNYLALKVPAEFDVMLQFGDKRWDKMLALKKVDECLDVIKAAWKFKNGKDLPVTEDVDVVSSLSLQKPHKWQPSFSAVMTVSDLTNHIRSLGISAPGEANATTYDVL